MQSKRSNAGGITNPTSNYTIEPWQNKIKPKKKNKSNNSKKQNSMVQHKNRYEDQWNRRPRYESIQLCPHNF
jgi:hypothetical protein